MMKIILFQLLIFLTVNAFRTNDTCFKSEAKCEGSFNFEKKYTVQCAKHDSCVGHFKFACGVNYCSKDEASCQSLLYLNALMRSLGKSFTTYRNILIRFGEKIKSIQNCSVYSEYKLKPNDVCINGDRCFIRKPLKLNRKVNLYKRIDCPCSSAAYQCGKNYCAASSEVCTHFIANNNLTQLHFKLQQCGNNNLIVD